MATNPPPKVNVPTPVDYIRGSLTPGQNYTAWKTFSGQAPTMGKGNAGPGTPYTEVQKTVQKPKPPPAPPKPKPKPAPAKKAPLPQTYTVQRGDTLSGIGKKYGLDWRDIWNYNLQNRNQSAVQKLKSRGPNLIYKGSTFLIPSPDWKAEAIRRRLG